MKKLFSKSFFIELNEAQTYPSVEFICSDIEGYTAECNKQLKFKSEVKPITFYLEDVLYHAEIKMARGGYYIYCSEVKYNIFLEPYMFKICKVSFLLL
ncbi:Uncharacterized protein BW664_02188 [Bacillus mycoides]|nr:Uncharacterized protein BW664_02188 [Bacillus mycoides]